uniref:DNA-directed RNA polymerase II subunit n=1 Tax=Caudovirales sp. ctaix4 TaxID=2827635 RepID=A0A8S5S576_9CAUD|nr:MAG TPA: DNA-directed RNA polymerase II subunit [Caudovirales sp. ctaix4]
MFCRHKNLITGRSCSKSGMVRMSGDDVYTVCMDCGTIIREIHTEFKGGTK